MIEQAVKNAIEALKHYSALVDNDDEASPAVRAIAGLLLAMEELKKGQ